MLMCVSSWQCVARLFFSSSPNSFSLCYFDNITLIIKRATGDLTTPFMRPNANLIWFCEQIIYFSPAGWINISIRFKCNVICVCGASSKWTRPTKHKNEWINRFVCWLHCITHPFVSLTLSFLLKWKSNNSRGPGICTAKWTPPIKTVNMHAR